MTTKKEHYRQPMYSLLHNERGVSAIEFALIAPILIFALLATVDTGLAVTEKMGLDHVLRAGAQAAMIDPGQEKVRRVLETAASENFTLAGQAASANSVSLSATRFCACPESRGVPVACSQTCASSAGTFAYYKLAAVKMYQGMILPRMSFTPAIEVQVK